MKLIMREVNQKYTPIEDYESGTYVNDRDQCLAVIDSDKRCIVIDRDNQITYPIGLSNRLYRKVKIDHIVYEEEQ